MMTSPLFHNIDSKIRDITNIYIHVSKRNSIMTYDYYDVEQQYFIKSEQLDLNKISSYIGDIYDTYEMVIPLEYPKTRDEYIKIFSEVKELNKEYMMNRRMRT